MKKIQTFLQNPFKCTIQGAWNSYACYYSSVDITTRNYTKQLMRSSRYNFCVGKGIEWQLNEVQQAQKLLQIRKYKQAGNLYLDGLKILKSGRMQKSQAYLQFAKKMIYCFWIEGQYKKTLEIVHNLQISKDCESLHNLIVQAKSEKLSSILQAKDNEQFFDNFFDEDKLKNIKQSQTMKLPSNILETKYFQLLSSILAYQCKDQQNQKLIDGQATQLLKQYQKIQPECPFKYRGVFTIALLMLRKQQNMKCDGLLNYCLDNCPKSSNPQSKQGFQELKLINLIRGALLYQIGTRRAQAENVVKDNLVNFSVDKLIVQILLTSTLK